MPVEDVPQLYQSSGKVRWSAYLPMLALTFVLAGLTAWGMHLLWAAGHYYILVVALAVALLLSAPASRCVGLGHCRNRRVGLGTGIAVGLVVVFGFYHIGMVDELGAKF